jgi:hypothetical protein
MQNCKAWVLVGVLAAILLVSAAVLFTHFRTYLVARYWGRGADFAGAHLEGTWLQGADLRHACLASAQLQGVNLRHADLREANFSGADLRNADLKGADLRLAWLLGDGGLRLDLRTGKLFTTTKIPTNLQGADLRGADLSDNCFSGGVDDLTGAPEPVLTGARYDASTRWPPGFEPRQYGAILAK